MISYHPDSRFLTDFASGNLPLGEAVCVSAHLEFCGRCRVHVQQLKELGVSLFSRIAPEPLAQDSFEQLMTKIDAADGPAQEAEPAAQQVPRRAAASAPRMHWPRALGQWPEQGLAGLQWAQFGKALRIAPLPISGDARELALYDIKAGGRMPEHEHRGEEITVLLKGSFSDVDGSYAKGDFVVRNAGEAHQPTATQDADCICLVCLEHPVQPRGFFYRLVGPLVQYRLNKAKRSMAGLAR